MDRADAPSGRASSNDAPRVVDWKLETFADSMPQLVWIAAEDGRVEYYNARVHAYMGAEQAEDGSWRWRPMLHPEDVAVTIATWRHAVSTRGPYVCEHRARMVDGSYRWHLSRAELATDPVTGEARWFGYATDVHEQKVAEERLHEALDRLMRLQAVTATLSAPLWGESQVLDALLGDGVRAAGASDGTVLLFDRQGRSALVGAQRPGDDQIIRQAMSERRVVVHDVTVDDGATGGVCAAISFPTALGIVGGLVVRYVDRSALSPHDHAALRTVAELGAQALLRSRAYQDEQRRADQAEALQDLAAALAESTTALAVADAIATFAGRSAGADFANVAIRVEGSDRLRLFHARSISQEVADAWPDVGYEDRTPLSDAVRTARPVFVGDDRMRDELYPHLAESTRETPTVATASLPMRTQDGRVVGALGFAWFEEQQFADDDVALLETVVALSGQALQRALFFDAEQAAFHRTQQLQRVTAALAQASRSGDVVHVVETQLPQAFGVERASLVHARAHGPAAPRETLVPLDGSDASDECLLLVRDESLTPSERLAAETFAAQCARALARTRLAEREHQIAAELQNALLGEVDIVDGLSVGTVYLASEEGLDIGGDWYDVIHRSGETAVLVVGDVVGHSLGAATAMGQLRSAVRALAHLCDSPEVLLARVSGYAEHLRDAQYSTLVLVYLHVPSGRFRFTCAGHPPPLLVDPDGSTRFVESARNPPLGAFAPDEVRAGQGEIAPGGSLVLYTDGLVEHRGAPIDDGLADIARIAGSVADHPPELIATRLVDEVFEKATPRDDVAVLVVTPPPNPSEVRRWRFAADPSMLGRVRSEMRAFLRDNDVADARIDDALLLAGEAVGNAVEHAYHGRSIGGVDVRLERRGDDLRLVVVDQGGWRVPNAPGERGRGVGIMRALADELVIDRRARGTTVFARLSVQVK